MPRLQRFVLQILLFISLPAVLVTLLSALTAQVWWLKLLDFPRFQLLLLHLAVLVLLAGLLLVGRRQAQAARRWVLGLNLLGAAVQLYFLLPYLPLAPRSVPDATAAQAADTTARLRLLEANVLQKNNRADLLLAHVAEQCPDIVLVLETDQTWVTALRPLRKEYPYFVELPRPNTYGMALYSRLPLLGARAYDFQEPGVPTIITDVRLPNGRLVRLYAVHPSPPVPSEHPTSLSKPNMILLQVGRRVRQHPGPALVLGDFNDVSWSHTTRMFEASGELHNVRRGRGMFSTFNATSWTMRWPLDHLFVTKEFRLARLQRLPDIGSDHFPLLAEVVLAE
ncbi:endonuclease/exonuclease/phosphatase family protein [Hymenobacter lapidiphilus]|uniref:Endonuclease/exonuclease/phosphatase family protein n=1 Tax=Hymenobacter lapidiphilus TaxID=2608003 RepID=A0A7Y7PNR9_9BACT|nr:endonuclease/exonuclease/phosphatase family protein [Hymenobacter lapidiphilus]NVO31087.1 endonuclease/exonuclease/phosphatase family protein [Hymenobacter lapidiphilus]